MKIAALVILIFGLLTAVYGLAAVIPRYNSANSAWLSAPSSSSYGSSKKESLGAERDELRSRSQSYAMAIIAAGALSLILTLIGRKNPKPKTGLLVAGSVLCFVLFGVMQAWGNIF
jgi:hypothetical protein